MFCGGSKSAKGGPSPLADMDRGVQIRCDTGQTKREQMEQIYAW